MGLIGLLWLGVLTYFALRQGRELKLILLSLKKVTAPELHVGGTLMQRRVDFRAQVSIPASICVGEHSHACSVVDLSRGGAQILLDAPEGVEVGARGVLTISFRDFGDVSTSVDVVRAMRSVGTFGVLFIDPPAALRDSSTSVIRGAFRDQMDHG